jgi:endonuclease/exonuclease/phosphatase family metal-dependent hydrolase
VKSGGPRLALYDFAGANVFDNADPRQLTPMLNAMRRVIRLCRFAGQQSMKYITVRRLATNTVITAALSIAAASPAIGQTIQITGSNATVLRGGTYADMNLSTEILSTRASGDASYKRRVVLTFDTESTIPVSTHIASATLTLTVAGGNAEARNVLAYRVKSSYAPAETTWNRRSVSTAWTVPGAELAERAGSATVTNAVGSRITFDVTALVQSSVNGSFGARASRIALVDDGGSSRDSYKEYFSDRTADTTVRPRLTVTYQTVDPPNPQLRVLQYNTHHGGYGTDGRYDPNRLATWMAMMTPDIIMLNEVEKFTGWGNEDQPARYKALMEAKTGRTWYMVFAQEYGAWTSNGKGHLILSTYPLESTDMFDMSWDRVAAEARITVNGRTISLMATHLDPDDQSRRLTQAKQVITWGTGIAENRILTGDMNAWPDQTSIAELNKTYNDSWTVAERAGTAVGFSGLSPAGATKKGRIDYIYVSKNAANLVVVGSRVYDTRDANGVMPSDHRPVLTTFEVR